MLPTHPHFVPLAELDLHQYMGVRFQSAEAGRALLCFEVSAQMLTPARALHAGYVYTACDLASYGALLSLLAHSEGAVTHDIHFSLMRTAGPGELVEVRAEVVRRGRSLAFIDARASAGERLLATARVTKSILAD